MSAISRIRQVSHPWEVLDRKPPEFNLADEALMHDLFGPDLQEVGTELLVAIRQLEWTEQSFGVQSEQAKAQSFDFLRPYLADFMKRCRKLTEEM